ncbi:hypothetical protein BH23BAC3_BH23BAC3_08000 [soil metagenome]
MSVKIPKDAYVIIIGAMKAGTTTLYNYLRRHPEICAPDGKEPEYFSHFKKERKKRYDRYEDVWSQVPERTFNPKVHKVVLEASTGYSKFPSSLSENVPKAIFDYGIHPRFIYILRNPFDRIVSHYNFMQNKPHWNVSITDDYLISISNYYLQLNQFRPYFPSESFLILDFNEIKENPEKLLKTVYEFLGISKEIDIKLEPKNTTRIHSDFEKKIRTSRISSLVRFVPQPLIELAKKQLSPPKRKLSPEEREYIYNKLKEDMNSLHKEYGVNVKKWGF